MSSSSNSNDSFKIDYFLSGFENSSLLHGALVKELIEFDKQYFPNPWRPEHWEKTLREGNSKYLLGLSREDFKMKGLILFGLSDPDTAHLYKILTHPSERRGGLAKLMLRHAVPQLKALGFKSLYLEVELTNFEAVSFYKKQGFRVLVIKKNFYGTMRDAWAMELSL